MDVKHWLSMEVRNVFANIFHLLLWFIILLLQRYVKYHLFTSILYCSLILLIWGSWFCCSFLETFDSWNKSISIRYYKFITLCFVFYISFVDNTTGNRKRCLQYFDLYQLWYCLFLCYMVNCCSYMSQVNIFSVFYFFHLRVLSTFLCMYVFVFRIHVIIYNLCKAQCYVGYRSLL